MPKKTLKPKVDQEMPTEVPSLFSKGYSPARRRLEKGSRFTMSCFNCDHFYQAPGDDEEVCQNPDVLKYDMVVTDTSIYCTQWRLVSRQESAKSIFKKGKSHG